MDRMSAETSQQAILAQDWPKPATTAVWLLTAAYVAAAMILWPERYFPILLDSTLSGIVPLIAMSTICICLMAVGMRDQGPLAAIVSVVRHRGAQGAVILMSFLIFTSAYTTFKIAIPEIVPYYADGVLAAIGKALHGDYPWRLTHLIFPDQWTIAIVVLYGPIWLMFWFGTVVFAAFWSNRGAAERYLAAMALVLIICGSLLATGLSSVGPIFHDQFYNGQQYSELLSTLNANKSFAPVLLTADYLFANYSSGQAEIGAGISAAPSVHVAIAALNAFFFTSLNRWLGVTGWTYLAAILFGSVHLGWHYALDGYISIAIVSIIWWLTGKLAHSSTQPGMRAMPNAGSANSLV